MGWIFHEILSKNLTVTINWVQGHLDTKDGKQWFPPLWRALNIGADHFADLAAKKFELPTDITIAVQINCELAVRIQKRLVHILCSFPKSPRKTLDPKPRVLRPVSVPLEDEAAKSMHQLIWNEQNKSWRCTRCGAVGAKSSQTVRPWLAAKCHPVPSDAKGPVPVPIGMPHLIGSGIPHATHALYFYRGITFCDKCGSYASVAISAALTKVCTYRCTPQTAAQRRRLLETKHPQNAKCVFPLSVTTFLPDRQPAFCAPSTEGE